MPGLAAKVPLTKPSSWLETQSGSRSLPGSHRTQLVGENPPLVSGFRGEHAVHHQQAGLLHADNRGSRHRPAGAAAENQVIAAGARQDREPCANVGHMSGGQVLVEALPLVFGDLPQRLALPPSADGCDDIGDGAVLGGDAFGHGLGGGKAGVFANGEMQALRVNVGKVFAKFRAAGVSAGRGDDLGTVPQPGANDAFANSASAADDHDAACAEVWPREAVDNGGVHGVSLSFRKVFNYCNYR